MGYTETNIQANDPKPSDKDGKFRKAWRRVRAEERQADADIRTPQEQLTRLDQLGYTAKKERAKLKALIERSQDKQNKTTEGGEVVNTKKRRQRRKRSTKKVQ